MSASKRRRLVDDEYIRPSFRAVRVVHSRILGGYYVVRGEHHTPISGRFSTAEEARQWLADRKAGRG